ncbi:MAG: tRNA (adenosine(37)-N6)-dimethylallyltransferase MiaA [Fusobacteriaceae bacterium]|jgi:tRNA dimethylallyltransferase|nr:tRNA (adenosine(37)-N6)-dimethylallyltransferase MiaA [Fusobacteriaceae bacterium]
MPRGIVIAGPTGVGKTKLSLELAKYFDADIISADSAQIYKELNIGTAKIIENDMNGIKHHMIDIVEPTEKYSVGSYAKTVNKILSELEKENKTVLLVGGTGLYIDAICEGLSELPSGNQEIRKSLLKKTNYELYSELVKIDDQSARSIHVNDRKRIERALEVFYITGEKFSILSKKNIKNNNYDFIKIAVERNKEDLYNRINNRVDNMINIGLVQEVRNLYTKYKIPLQKLNIIGYREIIDYLNNGISLENAIELIKQNSRHYAKRQFTWFKNDKKYFWYNIDSLNEKEIIEEISKKIKM